MTKAATGTAMTLMFIVFLFLRIRTASAACSTGYIGTVCQYRCADYCEKGVCSVDACDVLSCSCSDRGVVTANTLCKCDPGFAGLDCNATLSLSCSKSQTMGSENPRVPLSTCSGGPTPSCIHSSMLGSSPFLSDLTKAQKCYAPHVGPVRLLVVGQGGKGLIRESNTAFFVMGYESNSAPLYYFEIQRRVLGSVNLVSIHSAYNSSRTLKISSTGVFPRYDVILSGTQESSITLWKMTSDNGYYSVGSYSSSHLKFESFDNPGFFLAIDTVSPFHLIITDANVYRLFTATFGPSRDIVSTVIQDASLDDGAHRVGAPFFAADFAACQSHCDREQDCNGATWSTADGTCVLVNDPNQAPVTSAMFRTWQRVDNNLIKGSGLTRPSISFITSNNVLGTPVTEPSLAACKSSCYTTARCNAVTRALSTQLCYLLVNTYSEGLYDANTESWIGPLMRSGGRTMTSISADLGANRILAPYLRTSIDVCVDDCKETAGCVAATWGGGGTLCSLLNSFSTTATASGFFTWVSPPVAPGSGIELETSYDTGTNRIPGGFFAAANMAFCVVTCSTYSACVAVTWVPTTGDCSLLNSVATKATSPGLNARSWLAPTPSFGVVLSDASYAVGVSQTVAVPSPAGSMTKCQSACLDTASCQSASFNTSGQICSLMNSATLPSYPVIGVQSWIKGHFTRDCSVGPLSDRACKRRLIGPIRLQDTTTAKVLQVDSVSGVLSMVDRVAPVNGKTWQLEAIGDSDEYILVPLNIPTWAVTATGPALLASTFKRVLPNSWIFSDGVDASTGSRLALRTPAAATDTRVLQVQADGTSLLASSNPSVPTKWKIVWDDYDTNEPLWSSSVIGIASAGAPPFLVMSPTRSVTECRAKCVMDYRCAAFGYTRSNSSCKLVGSPLRRYTTTSGDDASWFRNPAVENTLGFFNRSSAGVCPTGSINFPNSVYYRFAPFYDNFPLPNECMPEMTTPLYLQDIATGRIAAKGNSQSVKSVFVNSVGKQPTNYFIMMKTAHKDYYTIHSTWDYRVVLQAYSTVGSFSVVMATDIPASLSRWIVKGLDNPNPTAPLTIYLAENPDYRLVFGPSVVSLTTDSTISANILAGNDPEDYPTTRYGCGDVLKWDIGFGLITTATPVTNIFVCMGYCSKHTTCRVVNFHLTTKACSLFDSNAVTAANSDPDQCLSGVIVNVQSCRAPTIKVPCDDSAPCTTCRLPLVYAGMRGGAHFLDQASSNLRVSSSLGKEHVFENVAFNEYFIKDAPLTAGFSPVSAAVVGSHVLFSPLYTGVSKTTLDVVRPDLQLAPTRPKSYIMEHPTLTDRPIDATSASITLREGNLFPGVVNPTINFKTAASTYGIYSVPQTGIVASTFFVDFLSNVPTSYPVEDVATTNRVFIVPPGMTSDANPAPYTSSEPNFASCKTRCLSLANCLGTAWSPDDNSCTIYSWFVPSSSPTNSITWARNGASPPLTGSGPLPAGEVASFTGMWAPRQPDGVVIQMKAQNSVSSLAFNCQIALKYYDRVATVAPLNVHNAFALTTNCWAPTSPDESFHWLRRIEVIGSETSNFDAGLVGQTGLQSIFTHVPFRDDWFIMLYLGEYNFASPSTLNPTDSVHRGKVMCALVTSGVPNNFGAWILEDVRRFRFGLSTGAVPADERACLFQLTGVSFSFS